MESETNLAADPDQIETEASAPETEEPEKPETNEHDVPPVLDKPELDIVDRVVIVEVVREDDKKETQIQLSDDQIENEVPESIPSFEDVPLVGIDAEETLSSESDQDTESDMQSESEVESDAGSVFDIDCVVLDADNASSEFLFLEDVSKPETETQSEIVLFSDADITSYLQSIDSKLSCIIFIFLFMVCEHKLRCAVRSFCGRINKND
ncbi:MAG: hypothetical protein HDR25_01475 [Lachnospiraceae bacterium]|nr:hypothetical protein [Lachnospiraceae bacterium]